MPQKYVIGVDVGTGSVRAGVFDIRGNMLAHAQHDIQIWRPQVYDLAEEGFVEQSSEDIWSAACCSVRVALGNAGVTADQVAGISYDATCSLVALDARDQPVTVSPTGNPEQNIIVWMDHRAIKQAARINASKHKALRYVGGKISPEMEPPKLLWIKENLKESWNRTSKFLDLADFMTYRSAGIDVRSLCTTVCKWTYVGHKGSWDTGFFEKFGMGSLLKQKKMGSKILPMGTCIGNLTPASANELGLTTNTKVAVGIIDAHAGGLGVIGIGFDSVPRNSSLEQILALIGGTSSCHMSVSRGPQYIRGIWGPYYSAMIPGMWLTEGGQSATGSLLDYIIKENSAYTGIKTLASERGMSEYQFLNEVVQGLKTRAVKGPEITKEINVLPYFHGNRSPRADPTLRGTISGLTLDDSMESVALRYYATLQSIAYGTRHIIEEMNAKGYRIRKIHACGGGTKNPLWLQEHADITGCEIILPKEPEAVLLGSAMLAAVGSGKYQTVIEAAVKMSAPGKRYLPQKKFSLYHKEKYLVFKKMCEHSMDYRRKLARF
ncbi:MAG TPA: FGGY-family carbohydrate kinase [Bacteroidota bacterium]